MTYFLKSKPNKAGVEMYHIVVKYKDDDGKWRNKWKATGLEVKNNKKRAIAFAEEYVDSFEKAHNAEKIAELNAENVNADVDFLQYFEYCLDGAIKNRVEPNTYDGYRAYYETHIQPYFEEKGLLLSQVSKKVLQAFYDKMLKSGRLNGKGGLKAKTVKKYWVLINRVFGIACKDEDLLDANPNLNCKVEKNEENDYEAPFYSEKEVYRLLSVISPNEPFYAMLVLGAFYGLRRSEVLGLKWDAVDLKNDTISIKRKVVVGQREYRRQKTKNKASKRILPLFPEVKNILVEMKFEQNKNKKLFGNQYKDTEDYIFVWGDGTLIRGDYPSRRLHRVVKQYNLPRMNFHGLRHSCASILISKGFSLLQVSKFLGHSSPAVTGSVYGHLFDEGKSDMANAMNESLAKAKAENLVDFLVDSEETG